MIIKSFEIDKIKLTKNNLILLYGSNQGHKNHVIKELFVKVFNGQISRLDESEILNNYEEFISSLINKSLFEDHKLIIVSRTSEKIIKLVNDDHFNQIFVTDTNKERSESIIKKVNKSYKIFQIWKG